MSNVFGSTLLAARALEAANAIPGPASNVYGTILGLQTLEAVLVIPGTALIFYAMPQWGISPALGVDLTVIAIAISGVAIQIIARVLPDAWKNDRMFMTFVWAAVTVLSYAAAAGIFAIYGAPLAWGEVVLIVLASVVGGIAMGVLAFGGTCCCCCGQVCRTEGTNSR